MIKAVLFDFGGVLFPSLASPWKRNCRSVPEINKLKNPVIKILEKNWKKIEAKVFGREELKQALLELNIYSDSEIGEILRSLTSINNNALDLAKTLKNKGLIICSLNNERPFWTNFRRIYFSLDRVFSHYFVSCEIGWRKPALEIYRYALSQLNLQGKECFFTDDREENLEAARKFGMLTHHFKDVSAKELKNVLQEFKLID